MGCCCKCHDLMKPLGLLGCCWECEGEHDPLRNALLQKDALEKRVKTLEDALLEKHPSPPIDWEAMAHAIDKETPEFQKRLLDDRDAVHDVLTAAGVKSIYSVGSDRNVTATRVSWLVDERDAANRRVSELQVKLDVEKARADVCSDNAAHWQKDYEDANRQNSELKDALHEVLIGLRRLDCDNRWREEIEDAGKLLTEKRDGFTPIPGLPDCVSCHHGGKLCGYHDKREGVRPPPKCDACEWHHYKDEPHGKRQVSS